MTEALQAFSSRFMKAGTWLAQQAARIRSDLPLAILDAGIATVAYTGITFVRFDGAIPQPFEGVFPRVVVTAVCVHLLANWTWGLYGEIWRHASVQEARRVLLAGGFAVALLAVFFLRGGSLTPFSVLLLGGATTTMFAGAVRFHARLFAFHRNAALPKPSRVAVVGAGESGAAIVRDMLRSPDAGLLPVVVLDDDPRKQGRALHGIPILGGCDQLPQAVRRFAVDQTVLAIPSADGETVRRVATAAEVAGSALKILPSMHELVDRRVTVRDVRDLEIADLLGRAQVLTDPEAVQGILRGRRVLITGAGGSIGSEIARQAAACKPASLVLLDHDETHLYDAASEIDPECVPECVQVLADVRDRELMDAIVARHRPQVIFHAAAHKHVPMLEAHPCEAIATNVLGTLHTVDAAVRHGTERFVLISTDKAVRPSSVMGASKLIAEHIVLSRAQGVRRYCAVRFGNVLGSRGSVIPLFLRQIARGGPVTVTDARMTRYFMSTSEAVQLVLQAAVFAVGGEVFMLEMGEPVRILDLAERMIRLSGRRVGTDVSIKITGMRPGEKLTEELSAPSEVPFPTAHDAIVGLLPEPPDPEMLRAGLQRLAELARRRDEAGASAAIRQLAASPEILHIPPHLNATEEDPRWSCSTSSERSGGGGRSSSVPWS